MKTENIVNKLNEAGFTDLEVVGTDVKVNIGNMAKTWKETEYASERACFDGLKLQIINWAAVHNTSAKRDGGAIIVYGK